MTLKKAKVLLNRLGLNLQAPAFDSRLAKYLLLTVENNEISTIANLYGQTYLVDDETFYGKVSKKLSLRERNSWSTWLARLLYWLRLSLFYLKNSVNMDS